mgnify:FL=1
MDDFENKYGNFSFDSRGIQRSADDARGKIDELMNDEELKEALRKMKSKPEEKSYVTPGATAKEVASSSGKGLDIKCFIDPEAGEKYPEELRRLDLECIYIGLLLNNPPAISMYYFVSSLCLFADPRMINIYKGVLFTEGEAYAPAIAKENFNFATESGDVYTLKNELKKATANENYDFEKVYTELKKIFILRKAYNGIPIKEIKDKVAAITKYELYDQMTADEVEAAIEQITATAKFKSAVLNDGLTSFITKGNNSLTNGLDIPFRILSSVFKGVRLGETMAFAMPSNSGKSRFTTVLAAYIAFIHKKKVLIISNEMSEEKIKLCLATTILNNAQIQNLHGQKVRKTENEILEFKYRPDDQNAVKVDEDGFILKEEGETHEAFVERLRKVSSEFNMVTKATDWLDNELNNSIYFINITDHTNDELKKVITNYYYRYKIQYMFYDTLKTDTANIGNGEEIKKTATILSNLAQNFNIFICSSLQLTETATLPINLTVNDLAVSRTVKEVLDTLMLIKQIHNENLEDYEYSDEEVDTKYYDLERFKDPNVRYYACVVDKNRAGSKPKVVFRLNLAYNEWFELGYLRLKTGKEGK